MTERRFLTFRLPVDLVNTLDRAAEEEGVSRHRLGCLLLANAIAGLPEAEPALEVPEA